MNNNKINNKKYKTEKKTLKNKKGDSTKHCPSQLNKTLTKIKKKTINLFNLSNKET
jgi:hypothetical protein